MRVSINDRIFVFLVNNPFNIFNSRHSLKAVCIISKKDVIYLDFHNFSLQFLHLDSRNTQERMTSDSYRKSKMSFMTHNCIEGCKRIVFKVLPCAERHKERGDIHNSKMGGGGGG